MKDTIITAAIGNAAILATGMAPDIVSLPAPEEIQSIGQLIIQAIIGIITVIRVLKDRKKPKN